MDHVGRSARFRHRRRTQAHEVTVTEPRFSRSAAQPPLSSCRAADAVLAIADQPDYLSLSPLASAQRWVRT
ncbi:hypothetical protein DEH69_15395 [Streptomyces sp. PT12]|nr:hypothetical protein DEH69_15395 [Streptomyces sp. PT12]